MPEAGELHPGHEEVLRRVAAWGLTEASVEAVRA
jgi:hypothetical protein